MFSKSGPIFSIYSLCKNGHDFLAIQYIFFFFLLILSILTNLNNIIFVENISVIYVLIVMHAHRGGRIFLKTTYLSACNNPITACIYV